MNVVERGKKYIIFTVNGAPVELNFCHKTEAGFIDGITSEELISVLLDRQGLFMDKVGTTENINVFTHLKQVQQWLNARNIVKLSRKRRNAKYGS